MNQYLKSPYGFLIWYHVTIRSQTPQDLPSSPTLKNRVFVIKKHPKKNFSVYHILSVLFVSEPQSICNDRREDPNGWRPYYIVVVCVWDKNLCPFSTC